MVQTKVDWQQVEESQHHAIADQLEKLVERKYKAATNDIAPVFSIELLFSESVSGFRMRGRRLNFTLQFSGRTLYLRPFVVADGYQAVQYLNVTEFGKMPVHVVDMVDMPRGATQTTQALHLTADYVVNMFRVWARQ